MATYTGVAVDAEGALNAWLNSLTGSLVGPTHPVDGGFFFELQRSPGRGTYGVVTVIGAVEAWGVEAASQMTRMSCSIFSTQKKAAAAAAVAYANTLRTLSTVNPAPAGYATTISMADNITGPRWVPNLLKNAPQYVVDADIYFTQQ